MGRVKGRVTKVAAHALVKANSALFSLDFTRNKNVLRKLGIMGNNQVELNRLAGEITVVMKQELPLHSAA
jgi:ribosomal protein S17E